MTTKSNQELTSTEIKMLRQRLLAISIFFLFTLAFFAFIYNQGDFQVMDNMAYIFLIFPLFFFGIIFYMGSGFVRDLFRGEKMIVRGIVSDKRRHKSSSSGRKRRSSSRPSYYLYFGEEKFYVDVKHYNQAQVGREIELHYAPYSKTSFAVELLGEDAGSAQSPTRAKSYEEFKKQVAPAKQLPKKDLDMSETDLSKLRTQRNQKLRTNISFALFMGLLGLIFTIASLLWWVMLIPASILGLVVFGFVRGAIKTWNKFKLDERSKVKTVVLTKVLDKQYFTGSGRGHLVRTEMGSYNVSKVIYDSLEGQETVFVSVGKHSRWLIELIGRNKQDESSALSGIEEIV